VASMPAAGGIPNDLVILLCYYQGTVLLCWAMQHSHDYMYHDGEAAVLVFRLRGELAASVSFFHLACNVKRILAIRFL
jgi:hypothetical protein